MFSDINRLRLVLLYALFLTLAVSAHAATPLDGKGIQTRTLPNGLKVILKEDHATPLVALDLWIKTGSAEDPANAPGTAHLLEHMLFKGTAKHGVGGIDAAMENLGGTLEASTLKDGSHLYCTVASRYYAPAVSLLAEVVLHASLPGQELEREKGVIRDEVTLAGADPMRRAEDALTRLAYGDHPYGRAIPGDPKSIEKVTRETVEASRKRLLVGSNLTLVIVGDVQPDTAFRAVQNALKDVPTGTVARAKLEPVSWQHRAMGDTQIQINGGAAFVLTGFPGPSVVQAKEVAALDLAYAALQLGEGGQLKRDLVGRGLARRTRVDFLTQRGPGLFILGAECDPARAPRVREVMDESLTELRDTPLSEPELASAKRRILSSLAFDVETYAGQAALLGFYEALGHPDLAWKYAEIVSALTPEDVQLVARKYLEPKSAIQITALPVAKEAPGTGKPEIVPLPDTQSFNVFPFGYSPLRPSKYPVAYGRSAPSDTLPSPPPAPMPVPAGTTIPVEDSIPRVPIRTQRVQQLATTSGMAVLAQPEPGQPILSVRLFVRVGAANEARIPAGSSAMLAQLLASEAAHPSIKDNLTFLADQVGGGLSVDPGEESTGFSVLTTKDRLNEALELLALIATRPRIRPTDIEAQRLALDKSESDKDAFRAGMDALLPRLYPGSRLGLPVDGTPLTRKQITADGLLELWEAQYRLGNMILVVTGDVDPATLPSRVEKIFKKKVAGGIPAPTPVLEPQSPVLTSLTILERNLPVGAAVVGVRGPGSLDDAYPAFSVLSAVLGGGKGSRLFHALRDEAGIGYDLGSWSPPRARFGYLAGYVIADPFRRAFDGGTEPILESARKIILAEMRAVAEGKVTEAEVERARRYVIGSYALKHQRVADRSYLLGWWAANGLGYMMDRDYPDRVEQVTQEEVLALARTLLKDFASLTLLPDRFQAQENPAP